MQEQFEHRPLLAIERLRTLQARNDGASALRLALHVGALLLLAWLVMRWHAQPWLAVPTSVLLAVAWAGIFAPFHECTHETAFATRRWNRYGTVLTGLLFGVSPAVYRTFHFEHHRHTQDPLRDPELAPDPRTAQWPPTAAAWWRAAVGDGLVLLKLRLALPFALKAPVEWPLHGGWTAHIENPTALARECRVLVACWLLFLIAALLWLPGGGWLLCALWLSQVLQTAWLMCEHCGLPATGSILRRTRSVTSNAFVRFWLWNMNYHAEHHAWPSIPWHRLPQAHAEVAPQLEALTPGYIAQHRSVLAGHPLATPRP
jgi:fatty acid desaturase